MTNAERKIRTEGVVAILRGDFRWEQVVEIAEVLEENGIRAIEYTWNSPDAPGVVGRLKERFGDAMLVGAGTLLTPEDYRQAGEAGAEFFICPHWSREISDLARSEDRLLLPGVLTPTEVHAARAEGWRLLKLFPANTGGPAHLKALRGPFSDVDFIPTGGVDASNARAYLDAGAAGIAVGSAIFRPGEGRGELARRVAELQAAIAGKR